MLPSTPHSASLPPGAARRAGTQSTRGSFGSSRAGRFQTRAARQRSRASAHLLAVCGQGHHARRTLSHPERHRQLRARRCLPTQKPCGHRRHDRASSVHQDGRPRRPREQRIAAVGNTAISIHRDPGRRQARRRPERRPRSGTRRRPDLAPTGPLLRADALLSLGRAPAGLARVDGWFGALAHDAYASQSGRPALAPRNSCGLQTWSVEHAAGDDSTSQISTLFAPHYGLASTDRTLRRAAVTHMLACRHDIQDVRVAISHMSTRGMPGLTDQTICCNYSEIVMLPSAAMRANSTPGKASAASLPGPSGLAHGTRPPLRRQSSAQLREIQPYDVSGTCQDTTTGVVHGWRPHTADAKHLRCSPTTRGSLKYTAALPRPMRGLLYMELALALASQVSATRPRPRLPPSAHHFGRTAKLASECL